jgi:hypothetical protein
VTEYGFDPARKNRLGLSGLFAGHVIVADFAFELSYDRFEVHLDGYFEGVSSIRKKVWNVGFVFVTGVEGVKISDLINQSLKWAGMLVLDTS